MATIGKIVIDLVGRSAGFTTALDRGRGDMRRFGRDAQQMSQMIKGLFAGFTFTRAIGLGARALQIADLEATKARQRLNKESAEVLKTQLEINNAWRDFGRLLPGIGPVVDALFDAFGDEKVIHATIQRLGEAVTATAALVEQTKRWREELELVAAMNRKASPEEIEGIKGRHTSAARQEQIAALELDRAKTVLAIADEWARIVKRAEASSAITKTDVNLDIPIHAGRSAVLAALRKQFAEQDQALERARVTRDELEREDQVKREREAADRAGKVEAAAQARVDAKRTGTAKGNRFKMPEEVAAEAKRIGEVAAIIEDLRRESAGEAADTLTGVRLTKEEYREIAALEAEIVQQRKVREHIAFDEARREKEAAAARAATERVEAFRQRQREHEAADQRAEAARIRESNRTPAEAFRDRVRVLDSLRRSGLISPGDYMQEVAKARSGGGGAGGGAFSATSAREVPGRGLADLAQRQVLLLQGVNERLDRIEQATKQTQ